MKSVVVISPSVSGNMLAEAVLELSEVKSALNNHYVIICNGTTNGYLARKLSGDNIQVRNFTAGIIQDHSLKVVPQEQRLPPLILKKGKIVDDEYLTILPSLNCDDVIVKGGNALDNQGNVGILTGADDGGTIGRIYGRVVTQGIKLILPVSLRKMIYSVNQASNKLGKTVIDRSDGWKVGLFPVSYGKVITEIEARERRLEIRRETDFYGAMDGASKFVRGDAMAGLIITAINIIGGLAIGVFQRHMGFAKAASTYTILTIGDGLVAQIPAIIISTSAGIIVTRAAAESDLGKDVIGQMLVNPKVLFIVASGLLFFALIQRSGKI